MRAMLWMGSVVVALAAVVGASRLWAESKEKKPAPRTRIGLINLTYVIKNYDKYKNFQEEMREFVEPFQKRDAELRSQLEELRKQATDPSLVPTAGEDRDEKARKEELEEKAKKIQREMEDNKEKIKKKLGKRNDEEMKIIYLDVYEATQHYASANDLDLVLHYNDAITKEDFLSAQNIARKLNTGALMPLYEKPNMEISQDLVALLNQKKHKK
jgi:Skp family chaperone for outer membrane proteins